MKYRYYKIILLALCAAFLLAGCAKAEEPAATAEPVLEEVQTTEEPVAEETAEAKKELPPPPDVDINSWEFLYASMTESIGRYHPEIIHWESQYMDSRCHEQYVAFIEAARAQGYTVWSNVSYRNWDYSIFWYEDAIYKYGNSFEAAKHVFPAGCSEHRTGLAFDITDESMMHANYYEMHDENMAGTEVYEWMAEHCTEYGFIVRYPEGHEEHFGRACYPGHFRYVGVEAAEYIMENDICFEEFLALYGVYKY